MILIDQISPVAGLLLEAADNEGVVTFSTFHRLFDRADSERDRYDTLEAASRALAHSVEAIYSAVLAKKEDGCPGVGFYEVFKTIRREEFAAIAGFTSPLELTVQQKREIAFSERARVYSHVREVFALRDAGLDA